MIILNGEIKIQIPKLFDLPDQDLKEAFINLVIS